MDNERPDYRDEHPVGGLDAANCAPRRRGAPGGFPMSDAATAPVGEGSFVLPGDLLDDSGLRGGNGTYKVGGLVYAAQVGYKTTQGRSVHVDAVSGAYLPRVGDLVIGTIVGIGPSNWYVEYDAPFQAPLHVNDVPWRVEFGETAKFLGIGDSVLVRVAQVDENKKDFVPMRR